MYFVDGILDWNFNLGLWDLFEIWFFGAWNFHDSHLAGNIL